MVVRVLPLGSIKHEQQMMSKDKQNTPALWFIATLSAALLGLLGLGAEAWYLQQLNCRECVVRGCEVAAECQLFAEEWTWSFLLIVTHLIPFALLPFTMCVAWNQSRHLLRRSSHVGKEMHLFSLQLGLTFTCIALTFEFGLHTSTAWYYRNSYHVLNYLFFLFLIASFALWADSFYCNTPVNILLVLTTVVCAVLYPIGTIKDENLFKVSLYASLMLNFLLVTMRGMVVLQDLRMLWVPFFSVVVNLFFIWLLQRTEKAGELTKWNYIFHMAHDLFGTELGVAVFAYLLYDNPRRRLSVHESPRKGSD
jgi:hypothetical protein